MSKLLQDGPTRHTEFIQERNQYNDIIAEKKGGGSQNQRHRNKDTKKLPERTHPKTIYTQFLIETQNFGFSVFNFSHLFNCKPVFKLTKYKNPTFNSKMLVININEHTCTFFYPNKLINLEMIQFSGRPGIHQGPKNDIFVFVLHMPSFELDFDVQKCTNLYIFNKTRIAGKRLRRMSYKLARWFIISASTYIPKYSSRNVSQPWQISNTSKYFTKMLHFHLQSSFLFEKWY